jgi:hypothetical protein
MTASKNYPTTSERPAEELPSRGLASKLVEIFKQKGLYETASCRVTVDLLTSSLRPDILAHPARDSIREGLGGCV